MGFSRAQTVPSDMWPEASNREGSTLPLAKRKSPPLVFAFFHMPAPDHSPLPPLCCAPPISAAWFADDDVDAGYVTSTIPDTQMTPVAGNPNGRYFLNTPEHSSDVKEASSQSKVCMRVCMRVCEGECLGQSVQLAVCPSK